jgi:hypothetical protein
LRRWDEETACWRQVSMSELTSESSSSDDDDDDDDGSKVLEVENVPRKFDRMQDLQDRQESAEEPPEYNPSRTMEVQYIDQQTLEDGKTNPPYTVQG